MQFDTACMVGFSSFYIKEFYAKKYLTSLKMFETRFWQLKTWTTYFNYEQIFSLSTMFSIAAMIQAIADPVNWAKVLNLAWLGKVVHDLQLFASSSMFCATSINMFYKKIQNSWYFLTQNIDHRPVFSPLRPQLKSFNSLYN